MVSTPNPGNPGGGNLQDSIDKLIEAINQQAADSKREREKQKRRDRTKKNNDKLNAAIAKLNSVMQNFGNSLNNFLNPIKDFQANIRSLGVAFDNETKVTMAGSLPVQTRMTATLAMLNSGIGDNSKTLGKFVARSAALNENVNMLTGSFRDMKNSLGLTSEQLDVFGTGVVNAAVTYKVSSDRLAKSMADLSKKIAVLGFTGATQSTEAIRDAMARTEMAVPGGLAQVLGPLMSGGMETMAAAQMSGMQTLLRRLTTNQVKSSDEIFQGIGQFVKVVENRLGGLAGQGPQVMNDILRQNYNISFEQFNVMKSMLEAADKNPTQLQLIAANVEAAETAITQLMPQLKEPLVQIAGFVSDMLTSFPITYKSIVRALTIGGIFGVLSKGIPSILASLSLIRGAIFGQSVANKGAKALAAIPVIGGTIAFFSSMIIEGIASLTGEVEEMNEREKKKELGELVDVQREARTLSVLSLGNILGTIQRSSATSNEDELLMLKQNQLLEALLLESRNSSGALQTLNQNRSPALRAENPYRTP